MPGTDTRTPVADLRPGDVVVRGYGLGPRTVASVVGPLRTIGMWEYPEPVIAVYWQEGDGNSYAADAVVETLPEGG